jgi:hypothetical protein
MNCVQGSGSALANGGPAALLIDFGIIGIMMFNVVYALGELAVMYPISGGFYTYSSRFIDPSWGFAMGWNYVLQWAIVLPLELTVAGITVEYWQAGVNIAVWITSMPLMDPYLKSQKLTFASLHHRHYHHQHLWRIRLRRRRVLVICTETGSDSHLHDHRTGPGSWWRQVGHSVRRVLGSASLV